MYFYNIKIWTIHVVKDDIMLFTRLFCCFVYAKPLIEPFWCSSNYSKLVIKNVSPAGKVFRPEQARLNDEKLYIYIIIYYNTALFYEQR